MKRNDGWIYIVLLLTLFLRLHLALTTRAIPNFSDMALYNELAAAGGFPSSFPPAYPLFLRLIYTVFGAYNYTAVFVIQTLLSVFTVWLIYYVTSKIENVTAGLVAAVTAAVYPSFIAYNLTTLTESVTVLLVMLLLAVFLIETDDRRRSILAAVTICVGFYVRPVFLFFIPGVLPLTRKRLWFIGVIVLLLAPWFINGAVSGGGSGRGARMFYKSYNEVADGITNYDLAETRLGSGDVQSGTYIREAFDFIRDNPWQTVNIIYNKFAIILCRGYDRFSFKDIIGSNKYIAYFFYYLHIPILVLGAIMMIRFYDRKLDVLILPSVSYLLASIFLAFIKIRYRLPIEPMFIIASSILVVRIAGSGAFRIRRPSSVKKKSTAGATGAGTGLTVRECLTGAGRGIRAHWKVLFGLLAVALTLRILFAVYNGSGPEREALLRLVHQALEGGIGPEVSPLYPLLTRAVFFIAGDWQILALFIVQGLVGTVTVLLLFAVTIRIFDLATAVITAGTAALYINFLVYGATVSPAFLSVFAVVLLTAVVVSGLGSPKRSVACGLIVGIGTMIQPQFLFLAPGLLLVLDRRKFFLAALVLTLLPLAIRNSIVHGSFLPVYPSSLFSIGGGNLFGLRDRLMIIDNIYLNGAVLLSRGWDKQQRVDYSSAVYMARYGYVLLVTAGLAGMIRYFRREQRELLVPILGYFLILVLFSRFLFQERHLIEPVLVIYTGVLLAGGYRLLVRLLHRDSGPEESIPPDVQRAKVSKHQM